MQKKHARHIMFILSILLLLASVLLDTPTKRELAVTVIVTFVFILAYISIETI